jgi:hypothetical protein
MDSIAIRRRSTLRALALAAISLVAAPLLRAASPSLPQPGASVLAIPFFVDRKLGATLRDSLEEAARRLSDEKCREVLADFTDGAGRRLDENLADTGKSMPDYLGLVLFYDGSRSEPCENERVLAWTKPGSRAVLVCESFFRWQRSDPGYAANIVIHEALHTLGLRESPPSPGEITKRVAERCGR